MDEKTIATYNQEAQAYDEETVDFWKTFPRSFLEAFVNASGPNILNIGSGPAETLDFCKAPVKMSFVSTPHNP